MELLQLDPHFFIQVPWQPELLKKWAQLGTWNEGFFPIYEWNGILYIAFAGTQASSVKKALPIVFLQCSREVLAKVFHRKELELGQGPFAQIKDLDSAGDFPPDEVFSQAEDAAPEGLLDSEASRHKPQGFSHSPDDFQSEALFNEIEPASSKPSAALEPQETMIQEASSVEDSEARRSSGIEGILSQLTLVFPKVMVLKLEKDHLTPIQWTGSWITPKHIRSYSLSSASPFRIVARTLKPFHGPVHSSEVGNQFAQDWNAGQNPEHLSIAAIMDQEKLVGLLLGSGSSECQTQIALQTTEKLAHKIEALNWFQKSA